VLKIRLIERGQNGEIKTIACNDYFTLERLFNKLHAQDIRRKMAIMGNDGYPIQFTTGRDEKIYV